MRGFVEHHRFPSMSLINSIIQRTNARFYLSYTTKIVFNPRFSQQNVKISPLENPTFLWTSTHNVKKRITVIYIFNPIVDYHI